MKDEPLLHGKRVAVLMTDGVEEVEFTAPRRFLQEHGARVTVVSPKPLGTRIQAWRHAEPGDTFPVEMDVRHARCEDFDALLVPGGVASADRLRLSHEAVALIRGFAHARKPIAAICHGPWPLIDAGVVAGRHVTSWPSLRADLVNAGAEWADTAVVVDGTLVTSRKPADMAAFEDALLAQLAAPARPGPASPHPRAQGTRPMG